MTLLLCYPGSPGTVNDFNLLTEALPHLKLENRMRDVTLPKEKFIAIGYSLGSWWALDVAAASNFCQGCILIAPYLNVLEKPQNSSNPLLKWILKTQLGQLSLGSLFTHLFLKKTSWPAEPPLSYQNLKREIQTALPNALTEKSSRTYLSQQLKFKPLAIIAGEKDLVTPIKIIRNQTSQFAADSIQLNVIPNAGHALIWTHTAVLSQFISNQANKFTSASGN